MPLWVSVSLNSMAGRPLEAWLAQSRGESEGQGVFAIPPPSRSYSGQLTGTCMHPGRTQCCSCSRSGSCVRLKAACTLTRGIAFGQVFESQVQLTAGQTAPSAHLEWPPGVSRQPEPGCSIGRFCSYVIDSARTCVCVIMYAHGSLSPLLYLHERGPEYAQLN